MPYIPQDFRGSLEKLYKTIKAHDLSFGELNYLIFRLCLDTIEPSYENYATFIGTLETCKLEIYRRIVATFENQKIRENGDITCDT